MRKIIVGLVLASCSSLLVAGETGPYVGLMLGTDRVDNSVGADNGSTGGLLLGWRIQDQFAVEGVIASTKHDVVGTPCTLNNDTVGIYGAFRSTGNVYFKGRLGFLSEDISTEGAAICAAAETVSDSGMSLGVGGGYRFGKVAFEVEYTIIEADVSRLSLSGMVNF